MKLTELKPMTSLEIMNVINAEREGTPKAKTKVTHTHVTTKIRQVVPEADSFVEVIPKFFDTTRTVYRLTKDQVTTLLLNFTCMNEKVKVILGTQSPVVQEARTVSLNLGETDGVQTMSSLDMVAYINATREPGQAELRHDSFMAKVPGVLGLETYPKFLGHVQIEVGNGAKRMQTIYNFPKREAMLMAMSYSYKLQATVYDAWQAAEAKTAPAPVVLSYSEALRQLADNVERVEAQSAQIAQQAVQIEAAAPAVAFVENYVEAKGAKNFRSVAKLLGARELDFRAFLDSNRIMYKLSGEWTAYQTHIVAGRFTTKTGTTLDGHVFNQVLFTPLGVEWVAKKWAERTPILTR